jgi:4-hydroxy-3-methylbut-2-enyl diphosphate reductase
MRRNSSRKIIIAKNSGFCSGVERAIDFAESLIKKYDKVYTLDQLLHNEAEIERLKKENIVPIKKIESSKGDVLLLPAHGATLKEHKEAQTRFKKVVDTTCPFVLNTIKIIKALKKENYQIAIVGDKGHRETRVLREISGEKLLEVYQSAKQVENKRYGKVGIVSQSTTFEKTLFDVAKRFIELSKEVRFFNTVCGETIRRQKEAVDIAKKVDCMLVIGGKSSANSNRLYELVKSVNQNSFFVHDAEEVEKMPLNNCEKIGIVSGTSTPRWLIEEVIWRINK